MTFSQLQERIRLELLRRIERGTLSVSLLARQTGLGQPHISNFLHGKRGFSHTSLDKILAAQRLQIEDLLPARRELSGVLNEGQIEAVVWIPLVPHAVAAQDPYIRASSTLEMLPFAGFWVKGLEERCSKARKQWDRFVAVKIRAEEARAMEPVVEADAVVLLDRHYTSFHPFRQGGVNLYGARVGSQLVVRYAQFQEERVVLRAYQAKVKADVMEATPGEAASDLLVGRVVLVVNGH
jgi:transcriptional regulator with XRE-family HTH domain